MLQNDFTTGRYKNIFIPFFQTDRSINQARWWLVYFFNKTYTQNAIFSKQMSNNISSCWHPPNKWLLRKINNKLWQLETIELGVVAVWMMWHEMSTRMASRGVGLFTTLRNCHPVEKHSGWYRFVLLAISTSSINEINEFSYRKLSVDDKDFVQLKQSNIPNVFDKYSTSLCYKACLIIGFHRHLKTFKPSVQS